MADVRFNKNLRGSSLSPFQPVGTTSNLLKHRVQKQYRTSDEQTILLQDYTILPQQRLPLIQIPVILSFYCSLYLFYAFHDLDLDKKLLDILNQRVGRKSIDFSWEGVTRFNSLAQVEVVEIEVDEYDDQIEKWMKKNASRIIVEKLEKRQRRFMDANEVKLGENCSVCLKEFEEERNAKLDCDHDAIFSTYSSVVYFSMAGRIEFFSNVS